jgi:hypothetical protein
MLRVVFILSAMLALPSYIIFITLIVPTLINNQPKVNPPQPIGFNHQVHVETAGMECTFCHRTVERAQTAGYPEVQQCMFCHQAIVGQTGDSEIAQRQQTEIAKLRTAWLQQQPVDWMRVHRMPDHVRFVHEAHVTTAGLQCATCHGDVAKMGIPTQVRNLSMGDCVGCHRERSAPTECAVCHK